jgi:hypothetical protein
MGKQRVSDQLKEQDQQTVRGVTQILMALQARYPQNLELKSAIRDMQDLARELEPEPSPAPSDEVLS